MYTDAKLRLVSKTTLIDALLSFTEDPSKRLIDAYFNLPIDDLILLVLAKQRRWKNGENHDAQ